MTDQVANMLSHVRWLSVILTPEIWHWWITNYENTNKDKSLALFHINPCSLNKNFNELEHLLSCTSKNFDIKIDWDVALKLDEQNVNYSTVSFLNKINSLLSNYAPLSKSNKYKLKFWSKPWITTGLQKSIPVILTNFVKKIDPAKKAELRLQYKNHRNLLSTLLKKSKENYYKKCFESNWNNAKIIWHYIFCA